MPTDVLFLGGTSIDLIQSFGWEKEGGGLVFSAAIGGSITNSAVISAKLGLKTALLSKLGNDPLGDFATEFLSRCGIDIKGVIKSSGINTSLAIAKIDKSGAARYVFYKNPPKDSMVAIKDVPGCLLDTCKAFHTGSSYSYQKETFEETIKFIKYLRKRDIFISYDPNIRPGNITEKASIRNRVLKLLGLADLAKISEVDLEYLTGCKCHEKGLSKLCKSVKCGIVLTLGSKGAIYRSPNGKFPVRRTVAVPAFKVKIADTIGAGDAFIAGLIYKLIKQGKAEFFSSMKSNMIFASAVSAIICTKKGANLGLKNIKQVNSFLSLNL